MESFPELPLLQTHAPKCGPVRKSQRGKFRALALIGVHLLIVAHIAQWKLSGTTLSPLEPSEAMQTLELGYLNAGFLLFVFLILITLLLGRFFCGWACHVVAYQDFCSWLLKKAGLKPRPVRSRLLVLVPLGAALYMFLWPQIERMWEGREFPALAWHLSTNSFWQTFPGFWVGALTFLVDGFLLVYFLGSKGFCTYGCPYGAFFGVADRLAMGKIRVTDACEGCGHCTATCTSNVKVHEEVALYGNVVDPGCMKCMDCVNVCPKGALFFGWSVPSLFQTKPKMRREKLYDFAWGEEIAMGLVFLLALYSFRGLYNRIPFFLAIGLSVLASIALLCLLRIARKGDFVLQYATLKRSGRVSPAGLFAAAVFAFFLLVTAQSGFVQFHTKEGERLLREAQALERSSRQEILRESLQHLRTAENWGALGNGVLQLQIGSILREQGDRAEAERRMRKSLEIEPSLVAPRLALADLLILRSEFSEAQQTLEELLLLDPSNTAAQKRKAAVDLRLEQESGSTDRK